MRPQIAWGWRLAPTKRKGPDDNPGRGLNVQAGQRSSVTDKTIDRIEETLGASGGNLAYAGYPYDPFMLDAAKH